MSRTHSQGPRGARLQRETDEDPSSPAAAEVYGFTIRPDGTPSRNRVPTYTAAMHGQWSQGSRGHQHDDSDDQFSPVPNRARGIYDPRYLYTDPNNQSDGDHLNHLPVDIGKFGDENTANEYFYVCRQHDYHRRHQYDGPRFGPLVLEEWHDKGIEQYNMDQQNMPLW